MKINKSKFEAWLANKKAGEIVGERQSLCACPLAKYLKTTVPKGTKIVVGNNCDMQINKDAIKLPVWASRFVDDIDETKFPKITAGTALTILKGAHLGW